jgi:peptidoglycan/LPS O-acetylase OafA/YrhL
VTRADSPAYRPDIDGLRAVAVLVVVAFHAFPDRLPGGYVGVDVFFAISGFLIGGMLLDELGETGRLRPSEFYRRRIVRILPALLAVLLTCLAAGAHWLPADRLRALGKQGVAAATFVSNLLLWREAGYFDQGALQKPLLHLWSLAVEEQFYLVAPLAIWGLVRVTRHVRPGILVLTALSFVVCLTRDDPTAAFYGPQSRFWEIGCGVWVAATVRARAGTAVVPTAAWRRGLVEAASCVGLLLIVLASWRFSSDGRVPVAANAAPVAGACLLLASRTATLNRVVLGHPAAVFVGKISYPLYLWHWPLLSFWTIVHGEPPAPGEATMMVLLAFALAVATWRWIETPMRAPLARRANAPRLAAGLAVFGGAAGWLAMTGTPNPRSIGAKDLQDMTWPAADRSCMAELGFDRVIGSRAKDSVFCSMTGRSDTIEALVLGDSSANSLYPGLAETLGRRGIGVANFGLGSCAMVPGAKGRWSWNQDCEALNARVLAFALSHPRVRWVYLGFTSWDFENMDFDDVASDASPEVRFAEASRRLLAAIAQLRSAGKAVVASFDAPDIGDGASRCREARERAEKPSDVGGACRRSAELTPARRQFMDWWRRALSDGQTCVFDQMDSLRDGSGDVVVADDTRLIFRDGHHLTRYGSVRMAEALERSPCAAALAPTLETARPRDMATPVK